MGVRRPLIAWVVGLFVLVFGAYAAVPVFDGFHLGCSAVAEDNERLTHLGLLWCKHEVRQAQPAAISPAALPPTVTARQDETPTEQQRVESQEAKENREFDEEHRRNQERAEREDREQATPAGG